MTSGTSETPENYRVGWVEDVKHIPLGIMPSALVDLVGPPSHIDGRAIDGRLRAVWSYDYLASGRAQSVDVTWGRKGAQDVSHASCIPAAERFGRVA